MKNKIIIQERMPEQEYYRDIMECELADNINYEQINDKVSFFQTIIRNRKSHAHYCIRVIIKDNLTKNYYSSSGNLVCIETI